jgi:anti-anti-sigma regulatory factor
MFDSKSRITNKNVVLRMDGRLTVDNCKEIKKKLLGALGRGKDVVLELDDPPEVDLSFLQLLCSAHRTAIKKKKGFKLAGPVGDVFIRAVEDSGFSSNEDYLSIYQSNQSNIDRRER